MTHANHENHFEYIFLVAYFLIAALLSWQYSPEDLIKLNMF